MAGDSRATDLLKGRMVGLSSDPHGLYSAIDYAINLRGNGLFQMYENGTWICNSVVKPYTTGDVF